MGKGYFLDTNVIIRFFEQRYNEAANKFVASIFDDAINISFITRIEIMGVRKLRPELDPIFQAFMQASNIFNLNEAVVLKTIEIRQKRTIKIPNALIAATAVVNEFTLVTSNPKNFTNIKSLKIIDPVEL